MVTFRKFFRMKVIVKVTLAFNCQMKKLAHLLIKFYITRTIMLLKRAAELYTFKEETIFEKNILGKSYLSHRIIDSFMWILLLFCISVWPKMVTNQYLKSTCVCLY